jgi:hypothetical protein
MARKSNQKRRDVGVLSIVEAPKLLRKTRKVPYRNELLRANAKLRALIDNGQFDLAKLLFTEMVKSSKYNLVNLWKVRFASIIFVLCF